MMHAHSLFYLLTKRQRTRQGHSIQRGGNAVGFLQDSPIRRDETATDGGTV